MVVSGSFVGFASFATAGSAFSFSFQLRNACVSVFSFLLSLFILSLSSHIISFFFPFWFFSVVQFSLLSCLHISSRNASPVHTRSQAIPDYNSPFPRLGSLFSSCLSVSFSLLLFDRYLNVQRMNFRLSYCYALLTSERLVVPSALRGANPT